MKKGQKGFTLVELAIALMVIGLLIGGVLKGQELIENARITAAIKQLKDFDTAVMIFRGSYGALPGDINNPSTRLPNCSADPCQISGTRSGLIDNDNESLNFWIHMDRAGLLTNVNSAATFRFASPQNPFGGHAGMAAADGVNRYTIGEQQTGTAITLLLRRIRTIDEKTDDGKPTTGSVYVSASPSVMMDICHDTGTMEYLTTLTLRCGSYYNSASAN